MAHQNRVTGLVEAAEVLLYWLELALLDELLDDVALIEFLLEIGNALEVIFGALHLDADFGEFLAFFDASLILQDFPGLLAMQVLTA